MSVCRHVLRAFDGGRGRKAGDYAIAHEDKQEEKQACGTGVHFQKMMCAIYTLGVLIKIV